MESSNYTNISTHNMLPFIEVEQNKLKKSKNTLSIMANELQAKSQSLPKIQKNKIKPTVKAMNLIQYNIFNQPYFRTSKEEPNSNIKMFSHIKAFSTLMNKSGNNFSTHRIVIQFNLQSLFPEKKVKQNTTNCEFYGLFDGTKDMKQAEYYSKNFIYYLIIENKFYNDTKNGIYNALQNIKHDYYEKEHNKTIIESLFVLVINNALYIAGFYMKFTALISYRNGAYWEAFDGNGLLYEKK